MEGKTRDLMNKSAPWSRDVRWPVVAIEAAVRIILGWGLLAYAVIHLVGQVVVRGRSDLRLSTIGIAALTLVLGIFLLTGDDSTAGGRLRLLGVILLVFGVLLAAWAYYLYSRKDAPAASAAGSVTEP